MEAHAKKLQSVRTPCSINMKSCPSTRTHKNHWSCPQFKTTSNYAILWPSLSRKAAIKLYAESESELENHGEQSFAQFETTRLTRPTEVLFKFGLALHPRSFAFGLGENNPKRRQVSSVPQVQYGKTCLGSAATKSRPRGSTGQVVAPQAPKP